MSRVRLSLLDCLRVRNVSVVVYNVPTSSRNMLQLNSADFDLIAENNTARTTHNKIHYYAGQQRLMIQIVVHKFSTYLYSAYTTINVLLWSHQTYTHITKLYSLYKDKLAVVIYDKNVTLINGLLFILIGNFRNVEQLLCDGARRQKTSLTYMRLQRIQ